MRPVKLTMTAFGPYKDTEVIDFTKLKDHRLFVIAGMTGAGKTTIFDAICFALYGAASGTDRENPNMLRSDFAEDDIHTAVELIFTMKAKTYRVLRQLGHIKAGNKSRTGEKYELYEIKATGEEVSCLDKQQVKELNEQLESLIGLTQDQFKQIVMLPQGEFRKLLTSDTENKEVILRRLFKTEKYNVLNDILKEKTTKLKTTFQSEEKMMEHYIQSIPQIIDLSANEHLATVLQQEHYQVEQVLTALQPTIVELDDGVGKAQAAVKLAEEKVAKAERAYYIAKETNEKFTLLHTHERSLATLMADKPAIAAAKTQLDTAKRAQQLQPYEAQWQTRREELLQSERNLAGLTTQLDRAKQQIERAKEEYEQEKAKEPIREETKKTIDQLTVYIPVLQEVQQTEEQLTKLQKKIVALENSAEKTKQQIDRNESMDQALEAKLKQYQEKVTEKPALEARRERLRRHYNDLKVYRTLLQTEKSLYVRYDKAEQAYKQQSLAYEEAEKKWLQHQATLLASHLHDGEACPVCGSLAHPSKAKAMQGTVSKEALDERKQKVEESRQSYQEVSIEYKTIKAQLKSQADLLKEEEIFSDQLEEKMNIIVQEGKQLAIQIEEIEQMEKEYVPLEQKITSLHEETKKLVTKKEQDQASIHEAKIKYAAEKSTYDEKMRQIPVELQSLSALQQKLVSLKETQTKLHQAWQKAEENLQQADKQLTTLQSDWQASQRDVIEKEARKEEAKAKLQAKLTNSHFATMEAYRAARMEIAAQEILEEKIKGYEKEVTFLTEQVNQLQQVLEKQEMQDLNDLELVLQYQKDKTKAALSAHHQAKTVLESTKNLQENIVKVHEQVADVEKQLAIMTELYDVLRGQNGKRISLERYLQIDFLEQITAAANERFKMLTDGKFQFIRSDRKEARGRQSGLGLDVYDAYTGQTRDVKTLSGGEKFIASLCLALGMSDVIQSFQGGISIEMMFIDEGFGSLDEESLYKSIDVLIQLQETGRMIGVISHVEELKAMLPAMLAVEKTKEGYSKTTFVMK